MREVFRKITLLKWLFLPVIVFMRLIVAEFVGMVLCVPFLNILCFYENYPEFSKKRNTITDFKVRMNN